MTEKPFLPGPLGRVRLSASLATAFFLSGGAALIYQVLWTRRLGLVFGVTIHAASTVLACFMAGLAIGSYVAGRRADRTANPLRTFVWVELLVGACAIATPWGLSAIESVLNSLAPALADHPAATGTVRVLLAAVVLIVPAALMGATYPLVLRAIARTPDELRTAAPLLYGINTSGAVAGVFAGSLWMVPTLGMQRSFMAAAVVNGMAAMLAFRASRAPSRPAMIATRDAVLSANTSAPLPARARALVLVVITLSGAVSLALEIIWFRVLVFFLRPTTYAFASMLAMVLIGLAIGSLVVMPWLKQRSNSIGLFGVIEVLIGVSGLISAFVMVRSLGVLEWALAWTWLPAPYDFIVPLALAAAAAIVPTSILLGTAFPLGLLLWTDTGSADGTPATGQRVGVLYALNVTGAIAGSLVAGFLLVPLIGARLSLALVSGVPIAGGVALIWLARARWSRPAIIVSLAVFAVLTVSLPDVFHDVITRRYRGHEVVWHQEDAQATVSVVDSRGTNILLIDGMHHANNSRSGVASHAVFGAMALAVHPDPKRVLVVGFGGGATAGSASVLPNSTVDVVELSPSVIEAGRFFERSNRGALDNSRVSFRVDDARHFLKTTQQRFDAITADLLLPEMAGAANLYSEDYFDIARGALAPGGLMVQWIDGTDDYRYKLILRGFLAAFPHVSIWRDGSVVIGSNDPIAWTRKSFDWKLNYPEVRQLFEGVGLGTFDGLTASYVAGRQEALAYVGSGPTLRDDRPVIEYFLSLPKAGHPADMARMRAPVD